MKHTLLSALLVLTMMVGATTLATAETLDDHLAPYCGLDGARPVAYILATYEHDILARAAGFRLFADTPANQILCWYVGALRTPAAETLATAIVAEGAEPFAQMVLGARGAHPDWSGLSLIIKGAGHPNALVRDSAATMLADLDYTLPVFQTAAASARRAEFLADLDRLIPEESDPRIKGLLAAARGNLARATFPVSGS